MSNPSKHEKKTGIEPLFFKKEMWKPVKIKQQNFAETTTSKNQLNKNRKTGIVPLFSQKKCGIVKNRTKLFAFLTSDVCGGHNVLVEYVNVNLYIQN